MSEYRRKINALTLDEMRTLARKLNIPKYRDFSKGQLVELILSIDQKEVRKALGYRSWFRENLIGIIGILVAIAFGIPSIWIAIPNQPQETTPQPSPPAKSSELDVEFEKDKSWLEQHYLAPTQNPFLWIGIFSALVGVSPTLISMVQKFAMTSTGAELIAKLVPRKYVPESNAREIKANFRYGSEHVYLGRWTKEPGWTGRMHGLAERRNGLWVVTIFEDDNFGSAMVRAYTSSEGAADLRHGDLVSVTGRIWRIDSICTTLRPALTVKTEQAA